MASASRRGPARDIGGEGRRYVASLLWPARLPRPANDNHGGFRLPALVSLAASVALLAAAVWVAVS